MVPTQDPLLVLAPADPLLLVVLGVVALALAVALVLAAVPRRDAD